MAVLRVGVLRAVVVRRVAVDVAVLLGAREAHRVVWPRVHEAAPPLPPPATLLLDLPGAPNMSRFKLVFDPLPDLSLKN